MPRAFYGRGRRLLFGHFTVADAYYAPVVMRFLTYAVTLPPAAQALRRRGAARCPRCRNGWRRRGAKPNSSRQTNRMQARKRIVKRETRSRFVLSEGAGRAGFTIHDSRFTIHGFMKIYSVGGAVRDELLGLPVKDRDYVVVGATPEEMVKLGYKPVGKDFPVFLHPQTHEEYALARTERKTARGYHGFEFHAAPDVTLEQDLARRDLTINAIARDEHGRIIDPFDGAADLKARVLRHVSPAFAEDPVRILRVARFAARFGFAIAPETLTLMREMVQEGEADALVAERVWQEAGARADGSASRRACSRCCATAARSRACCRSSMRCSNAGGATAGVARARCGGRRRRRRSRCASPRWRARSIRSRSKRWPTACGRRPHAATLRCSRRVTPTRSPMPRSSTPQALLELLDAADAWRRPERFAELHRRRRWPASPAADAAQSRLRSRAARGAGGRCRRRSRARPAIRRRSQPHRRGAARRGARCARCKLVRTDAGNEIQSKHETSLLKLRFHGQHVSVATAF